MTDYYHLTTRCANPSCGRVFTEGENAVMVLYQYEDIQGMVMGVGMPFERIEPVCEECARKIKNRE